MVNRALDTVWCLNATNASYQCRDQVANEDDMELHRVGFSRMPSLQMYPLTAKAATADVVWVRSGPKNNQQIQKTSSDILTMANLTMLVFAVVLHCDVTISG